MSSRRITHVLGFTLLVTIASLGAMFFLKSSILRFPYMGKELALPEYQALGARPGWQTRVLDLGSGVSLRGLVRPAGRPGAPFILFFNGNSGQLLREGQELLTRLCSDPTWGAAVWAYRGFDGSTGHPNPSLLEDDAVVIYKKLLEQEKLEPRSVHVVAFSLGTSIATALVAKARDVAPASLSLLAPLTEIDLGERFQLRKDRYETLKYLSQVGAPTLVIHGENDQTLPASGGKLIAERLGARARFVEIPKDGHFELLDSEPVAELVRKFVREHAP